ncbi:hypothetical protein GCM10027039_30150 [Terrabacter koreensis]
MRQTASTTTATTATMATAARTVRSGDRTGEPAGEAAYGTPWPAADPDPPAAPAAPEPDE